MLRLSIFNFLKGKNLSVSSSTPLPPNKQLRKLLPLASKPGKETMEVEQAKRIVLGEHPGATEREVHLQHLHNWALRWTICVKVREGDSYLCGWYVMVEDAWIEAARRILGVSPFGIR
ncbi:MAG: hypothetical protein Q7S10_01750 [bacterium]|nr:hypothetical protein [bacterium]